MECAREHAEDFTAGYYSMIHFTMTVQFMSDSGLLTVGHERDIDT